MDFQEKAAKLAVRVEICGNRSACIDGCGGIVDYTEDEITVKAGRMKIRFSGRNLRLAVLTDSAAVIEGVIARVEYGY